MSLAKIEACAEQLKVMQKLHHDLGIELSKKTIENFEKIIKVIKKQIKEFKMSDLEVQKIYESSLKYIDTYITSMEGEIKLKYSDFQALQLKKKYTQFPMIPEIQFNINKQDKIIDYEKAISDINFQVLNYSIEQLCDLGAYIFQKIDLCNTIGFTFEKSRTLIQQISKRYRIVPYHNFSHAFSVFLLFYQSYIKSSFKNYLDQFEIIFSLLACLGHDMNHQGLNNLYQAKTKNQIAIEYSYQAVLEKMHLKTLMNFFKEYSGDHPLNLINKSQQEKAKRTIMKGILATDMARHFYYVDELKRRVSATIQQKSDKTTEFSKMLSFKKGSPQTHQFLIEIFVHACDIGNPGLNFDNYITWANLLCVEFHDQTLRQQSQKVEVTGYLKYTSLSNFHRNQVSFSASIVLPLWLQISNMFPELDFIKEGIMKNNKKVQEFAKRKSIEAKMNSANKLKFNV